MTQSMISTGVAYRIASDHQAALRREAAQARVTQTDDSHQMSEPLPPTRGPLAALRRRLAGAASFA